MSIPEEGTIVDLTSQELEFIDCIRGQLGNIEQARTMYRRKIFDEEIAKYATEGENPPEVIAAFEGIAKTKERAISKSAGEKLIRLGRAAKK